jgi:O-methyltransferase
MTELLRGLRRLPSLIVGAPAEKKTARHNALAKIAGKLGFRVYGAEVSWHENAEFADMWAAFPWKEGLIHERRFNLYNLAKSFSWVQGDLAECGAHRGRGSYLLLAANRENGKHLYAFDSFEGLSEPTGDDASDDARVKPWSVNDFAVGENEARSNLSAFAGRFTLLKGWIPERFDEVSDKRFSLIHIDVDLYEPTRASIEFFWPRLNPGGLVVCDDYASRRCPGAKKAMDEFAAGQGLRVAELTTMQGVLFKPL